MTRRDSGAEISDAAVIALCKKHGDRLITVEDARSAGACITGIDAFRDRHFPGRDTATVAELPPHMAANTYVWRVLWHVLARAG